MKNNDIFKPGTGVSTLAYHGPDIKLAMDTKRHIQKLIDNEELIVGNGMSIKPLEVTMDTTSGTLDYMQVFIKGVVM